MSAELRTCPHCGRQETPEDRKPRPGLFCPPWGDPGGCGKAHNPEEAKASLRTVKGGVFGTRHSNSPQIDKFWETGDPDSVGGGKTDQPPMFD